MKLNCRKILVVLLSVLLIFSTITPVMATTPQETTGKVHVYTSFESGANAKDENLYSPTGGTVTLSGDIGGNWGAYNTEGENNYYRIEQAPGRDDYSLSFVTTSNATKHLNIGRFNLGTAGITGKLVYHASVYLKDTNLERRFQLRSLDSGSDATTNRDVIIFATNGNILDLNRNVIGQYQPNTWQNFKIFIDNENKEINYFVNEIYLGEASLPDTWSNVRSLLIYQFKSSSNVPGEMYVDDIMLSDYVPVTGLENDTDSLELTRTLSKQLNVNVLPRGASDTRLTFESSDENVVSVSESGLITGINVGEATITVTSVEGNFLKVIQVKVNEIIPLESIKVPERITIPAKTSLQLEPEFLPVNATHTDVEWRSENNLLATVDENGLVTAGENKGEVTIYVTSTENDRIESSTIIEIVPNIPVTNISLDVPNQLHKYDKMKLSYTIEPEDASNQNVNWTSDHPEIISVDEEGMITGMNVGKATITVETDDGGFKASAEIEVLPAIVQSIELPQDVKVFTNDTVTLSPKFTPKDATSNISWTIEDESIATVTSDGVVSGVTTGTTTVTATTEEGLEASSTIVVEDYVVEDEYDEMRMRWLESKVGNESLDYTNQTVKKRMESLSNNALDYWTELNVDEAREYLWSDQKPSISDSGILTENYNRLRVMAEAFANKGSSLYHNMALKEDILGALEWLTENHYTHNGNMYANWWPWEIGIPTRLTDILILMYDYIPTEQIEDNISIMDYYVGDISSEEFRHVGANRSDIMLAQIKMGVVEKSNQRLLNARDGLTPLFAYTTSGDGFYEDGSFIQHNTIAYTGSYGEVLIQGLGNVLFLLNGTAWEPVDPSIANVYRWIEEAYAPILYKGQAIDMTRGRAIVRENMDAYYSARNILVGISRIAINAPEEKAPYLKGLVKNHFTYLQERGLDFYDLPLDLASIVQEWGADSSIQPITETPKHFSFNSMARTVHRGEDYLFGLSMSSKRIATYELTNGQNPKGWYTGDGMTYIYNNDLGQYTDNFWATVNWHRLPGTTVVQRERFYSEYQHGDGETTPENSYAGGANLGDIGIAGMNLLQIGTTMSANKSWFMFNDVIVALGSGITSTDNKPVETIVEQRKLLKDNSNELTIDGEQRTGMLEEEKIDNPNWMHLQGNVADSGIGYVFLDNQSVNIERAEQEGRWSDITVRMPQTELVKENYVTMWFEHGTNPTDASYEYVLLPNASKESTEEFAAEPSIVVLENSNDVHAVKDLVTNSTGLNFWKDEPVQVSWANDKNYQERSITSNQKASVIVREKDGVMEIAVSDPTLENDGTIELEMDIETDYIDLIEKDVEVEILQLSPTLKIKTNVAGSFGKSFTISLQIEPEEEGPGKGNPGKGNPGKGNPGKGNPGKGNPGKGNPGKGNPGNGNPGNGKQ